MYWWVRQYPVSDAAQEAEVQERTAIQVYQYLRDICSWRLVNLDAPLSGVRVRGKHRARCINTQRHARLICYACYAHKLYLRIHVRAELDREFPNATCDHNSLCVRGCVPKRSVAEILPKFTSEHPKYQYFSGGAYPQTPLDWPLRAHWNPPF